MQNYDITILGGGLAGLTLARQIKLQRPETSILITERRKTPAPEAAFKVGESTVEAGGYYLYEKLKLKKYLEEHQLPKSGLRFFFRNGDNSDIATRSETGLNEFPMHPSFQLDRGRFENYLREENIKDGIAYLDNCIAKKVNLSPEGHCVEFHNQPSVLSRWVIDATGRFGLLKRQLNLEEPNEHSANAVWFRLDTKIDIDDWSDNTAWLSRTPKDFRWLSTNHLMGEGYWVWIIPLVSGSTSMGIVTDTNYHDFNQINQFEKALAWLQKFEPQCAKVIEQHQEKLQDFHALKNYSYGCKKVFSTDRWCLTGEAGVFLDPFYSPGTDYIGFSNDFITELVCQDFAGNDISRIARVYNQIYKSFYHATLSTYLNQYVLMGNAPQMTNKIIWDYAVYWGLTGLLFVSGKLIDPKFYLSIGNELQALNEIDKKVQKALREQYGNVQNTRDTFTDLFKNELLTTLHHDLALKLDNQELKQVITANIAKLEKLANEIFSIKPAAAI